MIVLLQQLSFVYAPTSGTILQPMYEPEGKEIEAVGADGFTVKVTL